MTTSTTPRTPSGTVTAIGIGFNGAETNCRIAHILGILMMNSCNTDIFFSNYYHLQSVRFEYQSFLTNIPSNLTCKASTNYPGIQLALAVLIAAERKNLELKICRQELTSSTELQNRSFHVVDWTR